MIYDDFNLPPASLWPREFPGGKNLSPKQNLKIYLLPVSSIVKVIKLTFCNEAESIVDKLCKLKKSKRKRKTEN